MVFKSIYSPTYLWHIYLHSTSADSLNPFPRLFLGIHTWHRRCRAAQRLTSDTHIMSLSLCLLGFPSTILSLLSSSPNAPRSYALSIHTQYRLLEKRGHRILWQRRAAASVSITPDSPLCPTSGRFLFLCHAKQRYAIVNSMGQKLFSTYEI